MDDNALAQRVDAGYFDAFRALAGAIGRPTFEEDGIICAASGTPVESLNVLFVTKALDNPESTIGRGISFFDDLGLPFVMEVREGIDEAAERAAVRLGLSSSGTTVGMALFPIADIPSAPEGLQIEKVMPARLGVFQEVMAGGFGMPVEIAHAIIQRDTLALPGFECYIGSLDGESVATSTLVVTGTTAAVYNVATLESHRRRGLGEALTWHAVRAGAAIGCDVSTLQASAMGRPIYERMGYRFLAPYRTFHRAEV